MQEKIKMNIIAENIHDILNELEKELSKKLLWKISDKRVIYLEKKPGNKLVKIKIHLADGRKKVIWVKFNKALFIDPERGREKGQREYETLQQLNAGFNHYEDKKRFGVLKPLVFLPVSGGVVTENFPGRTLYKILLKRCTYLNIPGWAELTDCLCNCGQWLARLHQITLQRKTIKGDELDLLQPEAIERDFTLLRKIGLERDTLRRVGHYLEEHLHEVKSLTLDEVGHHSDLSFRNLLVGPKGEIIGSDFENFRVSSWSFHSLALFLVYLQTLAKYPLIAPTKIRNLGQAFLKGYRSNICFHIDKKILNFFEVRYMTLVTANEMALAKDRVRICRWIILKRMSQIFRRWVNKKIR